MKDYDIAVIGLGVMGQSLARNIAGRQFKVLGWDRHEEKSKNFIKTYGNAYLDYCPDFRCLAKSLRPPRTYLIMVPAGEAVDQIIRKLAPYFRKGDIVIDAGNSHFHDTIRRHQELKKQGVHFVGLGVSGGEEGALKGPSLMPGCDKAAWKHIAPLLKKIAAKDFSGKPCVAYLGPDGAGHYVKMVHNGIEYGIMQMMAEAYDMLKTVYGLKADAIADIFESFNRGRLRSFLFEIAVPVLREKGHCRRGNLVDCILDQAGQKGTGRWTGIEALEHGLALPSTIAALHARSLSALKPERVKLASRYKKPKPKKSIPLKTFIRQLGGALRAGMIGAYAQGFELLEAASKEHRWGIDLSEVVRIWQGGCIIRADLLKPIHLALKKKKMDHLFESPEIRKEFLKTLPDWRKVASYGIASGIPLPSLSATLAYFESMTQKELPANFIQGLRDYFGAHTYQRTDRKGIFHTTWS